MSILILGLGNILLSDEGVGVRVIEHLEENYNFPDVVEIVDGGTCGMELAWKIADRDHVLIVDAVKTGKKPGTLITLRDDQVPAFFSTKISPHQVGLSDMLATLRLTDESPKNIVIFGIQPLSLETSLEMTPLITSFVETLANQVLEELETLGVKVAAKIKTGAA